MVNLTRIYTRTGDDGTTALGDFSRTAKTDPRLQAYADTNEANSVLGIALAAGGLREDVRATLLRVQNELFDVGADLCNPLRTSYAYEPLRSPSSSRSARSSSRAGAPGRHTSTWRRPWSGEPNAPPGQRWQRMATRRPTSGASAG